MSDYDITLDRDQAVVWVQYRGILNTTLAAEMGREARTLGVREQLPVLYDLRDVTLAVSLTEVYYYPREIDFFQDPTLRKVKTALVVPADKDQEFWTFYETTARNAGINTRLFHEPAPALTWLHGRSE